MTHLKVIEEDFLLTTPPLAIGHFEESLNKHIFEYSDIFWIQNLELKLAINRSTVAFFITKQSRRTASCCLFSSFRHSTYPLLMWDTDLLKSERSAQWVLSLDERALLI